MWDRIQSCSGKKKYKSKEVALIQKPKIGRQTGYILYPYKCRYCSNWHLGHNKESTDNILRSIEKYEVKTYFPEG